MDLLGVLFAGGAAITGGLLYFLANAAETFLQRRRVGVLPFDEGDIEYLEMALRSEREREQMLVQKLRRAEAGRSLMLREMTLSEVRFQEQRKRLEFAVQALQLENRLLRQRLESTDESLHTNEEH